MDFDFENRRLRDNFQLIADRSTPARLLGEFDRLRTEHDNPATDDTRKQAIREEIFELQRRAEAAATGLLGNRTGLSREVFWIIIVVVVGIMALFAAYFVGIGYNWNFSIDQTRPLLVMTLIVSMLGLGGMLTFMAFMSSEGGDDLNSRFRLAREVFLVFSGIFGTIIGFYFGAADKEKADNPISVSIAVANSELSAEVTGGTPPFVGIVERVDPLLKRLMQGKDRVLSLRFTPFSPDDKKDGDKDGVFDGCAVGATVIVIDSNGKRAEADVTKQMVAKTGDCVVPATPGAATPPNADPQPNNMVDPAQNTAQPAA